MILSGSARDLRETFEFTIESVGSGYLLTIEYYGDGDHNITGAGIWPTIEKAKEIAEESASRLLNGAQVRWNHG